MDREMLVSMHYIEYLEFQKDLPGETFTCLKTLQKW
jgi:hypothetical protein